MVVVVVRPRLPTGYPTILVALGRISLAIRYWHPLFEKGVVLGDNYGLLSYLVGATEGG